MNELIPFDFENRTINCFAKGEEFWVAVKDIANALGYPKSTKPSGLVRQVPEEWKGMQPLHTPGGIQNMLCLSEQGLYFFLGRSDKEKALPFQKKVAGEILPKIRKTGVYISDEIMEVVREIPLFDMLPAVEFAMKKEGCSENTKMLTTGVILSLLELIGLHRKKDRLSEEFERKGTLVAPDEKQRMLELHGEGYSIIGISRKTGRSRDTVRRVLKGARRVSA